jgi:hypothetical protein
MRKGFLLTLLLIGCSATFLTAEDMVHAGKAQFEIPDGWARLQNSQNLVLIPEDLPKGKTAYIAILSPRNVDTATTLSQWFKQEWQQLQSSYTVMEGGEPQVQVAKAGYETISAIAKVRNQENKISLILLMGAHVNDRVERILFLCDEDNDVERYQKGFVAFLSTLTFEDLAAPQTQ